MQNRFGIRRFAGNGSRFRYCRTAVDPHTGCLGFDNARWLAAAHDLDIVWMGARRPFQRLSVLDMGPGSFLLRVFIQPFLGQTLRFGHLFTAHVYGHFLAKLGGLDAALGAGEIIPHMRLHDV